MAQDGDKLFPQLRGMTFIQQSFFAGLHSLVRIQGLTVIADLVTDRGFHFELPSTYRYL